MSKVTILIGLLQATILDTQKTKTKTKILLIKINTILHIVIEAICVQSVPNSGWSNINF